MRALKFIPVFLLIISCTNSIKEENSKLETRNVELASSNDALRYQVDVLNSQLGKYKDQIYIEQNEYSVLVQKNEELSVLLTSKDSLLPFGTVILKGYSAPYSDTMNESGESVSRKIFVVVETDDVLEKYLFNIINSGNPIYRIVDEHLAIFYKEPQDNEIKRIVDSSSSNNLISVYAYFYSFPARGFEDGVPPQFNIVSLLN